MKKKLIIIGIIALAIFILGVFVPPLNRFFGAVDTISLDKVATLYNQATEIKAKYQLNEVSLVRTDIKNPELDKYKNEPKDEVRITIGDNEPVIKFGATTETKEFKPNIELKRWNEVSFKIKTDELLKNVATKDKKLSFNGDKIKFDTPKISFEIYDYSEGEGGMKFIWYLNEKPATNKVEFQIESSGLDFFYQPPLTQEYQNGYSEEFKREIVVTETQVKDLEGNVLVRAKSDDVIGSYVAYHKTKGHLNDINGKDYKNGKAFQIYRSKIVDANGNWVWAKLFIDAEKGIYYEEIPQSFLDKATYPIKGNQTFGQTDTGSYEEGEDPNYMAGVKATFSGGTGQIATNITARINALGGTINLKGILVLQSNKNIVSNGVGGAVSVSTTENWYASTFSTSPDLINGTGYYLMVICSGVSSLDFDNVSGAGLLDTSNNYTTPTNPTDGSSNEMEYSIYATYTPGNGAVAEDPPQIIITD